MARQHGKDTVIQINAVDISADTNNSEVTHGSDTHDTTTYGNDSHVYSNGLKDATYTLAGVYSTNTTTGPRAVFLPLIGATSTTSFVRRTEGTGSGLPQEQAGVFVTSYVETSPVADMVQWSVDLQVSGDLDKTVQ